MNFIKRICALCKISKTAYGGKITKIKGIRVWICKECAEEK
jgi:YgiT-type zinc finger domain-containing protein